MPTFCAGAKAAALVKREARRVIFMVMVEIGWIIERGSSSIQLNVPKIRNVVIGVSLLKSLDREMSRAGGVCDRLTPSTRPR
jgi:hypothetical protein